jgi:hypothetical protein
MIDRNQAPGFQVTRWWTSYIARNVLTFYDCFGSLFAKQALLYVGILSKRPDAVQKYVYFAIPTSVWNTPPDLRPYAQYQCVTAPLAILQIEAASRVGKAVFQTLH